MTERTVAGKNVELKNEVNMIRKRASDKTWNKINKEKN